MCHLELLVIVSVANDNFSFYPYDVNLLENFLNEIIIHAF